MAETTWTAPDPAAAIPTVRHRAHLVRRLTASAVDVAGFYTTVFACFGFAGVTQPPLLILLVAVATGTAGWPVLMVVSMRRHGATPGMRTAAVRFDTVGVLPWWRAIVDLIVVVLMLPVDVVVTGILGGRSVTDRLSARPLVAVDVATLSVQGRRWRARAIDIAGTVGASVVLTGIAIGDLSDGEKMQWRGQAQWEVCGFGPCDVDRLARGLLMTMPDEVRATLVTSLVVTVGMLIAAIVKGGSFGQRVLRLPSRRLPLGRATIIALWRIAPAVAPILLVRAGAPLQVAAATAILLALEGVRGGVSIGLSQAAPMPAPGVPVD